MTKKYCIYSNNYIEESLMNKEHIIPKKIGGQLDLSIMVDKKMNADLGSKIDAPFIENPYIKLLCKNYNCLGHSKKITPTFKSCQLDDSDEIADVSIVDNKIFFNKKYKKNSPGWTKSLDESKIKKFNVNFEIDLSSFERFFAKVLLASGYFMYSDTFLKYAYHEDLREIMNPTKILDAGERKLKTRILCNVNNPDPFMKIITIEGLEMFKMQHVIWSSFAKNGVMLGVSLFGNPILSANCLISNQPDKFLQKSNSSKGDVLIKELSNCSRRKLIKTTQEDIITKIIKSYNISGLS